MDPIMAQLFEANKALMATVANLVQQTAAAAKNNNKPNYDADEEDPGTSDKPSRDILENLVLEVIDLTVTGPAV
jgi:hypothetical protein